MSQHPRIEWSDNETGNHKVEINDPRVTEVRRPFKVEMSFELANAIRRELDGRALKPAEQHRLARFYAHLDAAMTEYASMQY